jgi:hypothetical protein
MSVFMAAITPSLNRNEALPADSPCNLPESVVQLDTGDCKPIYRRQYPIPQRLYSAVKDQVDKWMQRGVISYAPAGCQWNSPLLAVPKKDSDGKYTKVRVCLDPRALNAILHNGDNFEVPKIDDIIENLAGAAVFSTLDLQDSYHQFPIRDDHCEKTAFTFGGRQYMLRRTPFGLRHITSVFQRVMATVLQGLHFALSYVDDVVIFSRDLADHAIHTNHVLDRLTSAGLILNQAKCRFAKRRITLLGRVISAEGVKKRNKRHLVLKMNSTRQEEIVCRVRKRKDRFGKVADVTDQLRDLRDPRTGRADREAESLEDSRLQGLRGIDTLRRVRVGNTGVRLSVVRWEK